MKNNVLILGKPGSGKGTQADVICEILNIKQVSTGDIFRKNIKEGTPLGKEAKAIIDRGELVSDEITNKLVESTIFTPEYKNGYLLDGYPRTINQAIALQNNLERNNEEITKVIVIDVDNEVIVERMAQRRVCLECGSTYHLIHNKPNVEGICNKCGSKLVTREDDKEQVVLERLKTYELNTKPLIEFYEKQGVVAHVNGAKNPSEVANDIKEILS